MNHGKVLFFAYSDGSVEYRDRMDMSETFNDGNHERVWHLSQIGFTYPDDEPCKNSTFSYVVMLIFTGLQIAFSPSYCSLVQLKGDGKVQWQQLDYRLGDLGTSMEDRKPSRNRTIRTHTNYSKQCTVQLWLRCHCLLGQQS